MPATRVGLLYSAVQTDVTTSPTITAATTNAVAAGNTAFIAATARGATAGTCTLSGLPGDAVQETPLNRSNAASPAVSLFRCYFPSGMSASTSLTITWDSNATRKTLQAVVWSGVANSNVQASGGNNAANNTPDAGTSGASTTTNGVHVAAWGLNAALGTVTGTAGSDTEGTMTEQADQVVGAATFHYIYMEDNTVTAAHAGGETAAFTPVGTYSSWAGVQGIWAGSVANLATQFDEITAEPLTTGPWVDGPVMFYEVRDEMIFVPPVVIPPRPVVILQAVNTADNTW